MDNLTIIFLLVILYFLFKNINEKFTSPSQSDCDTLTKTNCNGNASCTCTSAICTGLDDKCKANKLPDGTCKCVLRT